MLKLIRFEIALALLEKAIKEVDKGTLDGLMKSVKYFKWASVVLPKTAYAKALIKEGDDSIKELGL